MGTRMTSRLATAATQPSRTLAPGEVLISEGGEIGGTIYVLETGRLTVERAGVVLATISEPNSLVGEMSVLLGGRNTATVRADGSATVHAIANADTQLLENPQLSFEIARLLAARLERTSELLVELSRQNPDKKARGLLGSIMSALTAPTDGPTVLRKDMFES